LGHVRSLNFPQFHSRYLSSNYLFDFFLPRVALAEIGMSSDSHRVRLSIFARHVTLSILLGCFSRGSGLNNVGIDVGRNTSE
jgi:hypothetical protein